MLKRLPARRSLTAICALLTFGNPLEDDVPVIFGMGLSDHDEEVAARERAGGRRDALFALGHAVHSRHSTTL